MLDKQANEAILKLSGINFYGPMTREEAFSWPVACSATVENGNWYVGCNELVQGKESILLSLD